MNRSFRLLVFIVALLIGIIALPIEFRQIELLARLIGNPLLLLVAHLGAVLGLLALLVFSFVWVFLPSTVQPMAYGLPGGGFDFLGLPPLNCCWIGSGREQSLRSI